MAATKFVTALSAGLSSTMGIIMIGAITQIITSVSGPSMLNVISADSGLYKFLYAPYQMTMNAIAVWEAFLIAYY